MGIVISDSQKKGRGRHGNKWISQSGNLFMSIFYRLNKNISINQLTKKNCLLIQKTLSRFTKEKILIKPPNDLLIKKKNFVEYCKKLLHTVKKTTLL